jgi:hypothetical protein
MLSSLADEQAYKPMKSIEVKAMKAIQDPLGKYDPKDQTTTNLINDPTPRMQLRIQADPTLTENQQRLQQHIQQYPGQKPNVLTMGVPKIAPTHGEVTPPRPVAPLANAMPTPGTPEYAAWAASRQPEVEPSSGGGGGTPAQQAEVAKQRAEPITALSPKDLAAANAYGVANKKFLATLDASVNPFSGSSPLVQTGNELVGIGPGLYHIAGGLIHHPEREVSQVGAALEHSYGETIHHPLRQLNSDPLGFITNVASPFFVGAGAAARAGEIGTTTEALRAGEVSRLAAAGRIAKILLRPQPVERSIKGPAGELTPPAYKSALGGLLQKHVFDPITEQRINAAQTAPIQKAVEGVGKEIHVDGLGNMFTRSAKYGREVRREQTRLVQQYAGAAAAKGAGKATQAVAEGRAHLQLWHELWGAAPPHAESYALDPERYVGIKAPPDGAVSSKGYATESGVANRYKAMVENDPAKIAANPDAYRFVPKDVWKSMQPYAPPTGTAAKVISGVNNVSQLVRLGRFLHPGYAAWAVQNGILHASQAGMFAFRNAWQLRNEYPRLGATAQQVFDRLAGTGVAHATEGEGSGKLFTAGQKLGKFWHKVDDSYWRKMSMIHELNHAGYHTAEDWTKLMRENPQRFRTIANRSGKEAIEYVNEMTPAERQTLQKTMTAYGWTRGATSWSGRFAWQHPVQARLVAEAGREGKNQVEQFYAGHNGMAPDWLRGYLPLSAHNSPWMLSGMTVNPFGTPGQLLGEAGLTPGSASNFTAEEAPALQDLSEAVTGMDRYGKAIPGGFGGRVGKALSDMVGRFEPAAAFKSITGGRTSGTFLGGPKQGLADYLGTGLVQLNNATKTAALGEKDYEQALSKPDEITFRMQHTLQQLPSEFAQYAAKVGSPPPPNLVGRIKGDLEMVQQRDLYQYHYASVHGAKSWKGLPPINKLQGTFAFIEQHKLIPQHMVGEMMTAARGLTNDKEIDAYVRALWAGTGIGSASNAWKRTMKSITPATLSPPNK